MPTLEEALAYLGIDYADDMVSSNVQRALNAAVGVVKGAVGDDVIDSFPDNAKLRELILLHMADLYDQRNTTTLKGNAVNRRIVDSIEWQLKLELKRRKEESA
ncbi:MAG: head-tail connector protein [Oscillospiraceae bacterium]|nr:head-tail connector protein [Oscillospiraceae bacterium]